MFIRSLEAHDVPPQLLAVWENALSPELLPLQEKAVLKYGLLAGENLVVQAPTSAGKTFIGEMAASRAALRGRRALYLAPTRALAEEKYRHFQELYGPLGLRVAVTTRDRRADDARLARGEFDLAVAVPEKVRSLWAHGSLSFHGLGLVVADELQMLADPQRGPCLEVLLGELRQVPGLQIVGLTACLGASPQLAEYLRAGWLETRERPVDLRQGVLCGDQFSYREYNTGREGSEVLPGGGVYPGESYPQAAGRVALALAEQGEPTLVFVRDRGTAVALAGQLAQAQGWPGSEPAALRDLEPTAVRRHLAAMMASGVAFHSSDLQAEERALVEEAFRRGEVRVLCATPTLALGVNLPAVNALIDPLSWDTVAAGGPATLAPISRAEYENRAGRAGRLGWGSFGRAILLADTELNAAALRARYLESTLEAARPSLEALGPGDAVLNLAALSSPLRQTGLAEAYGRTFTAFLGGQAGLPAELAAAARECEERRLLRRQGGRERLVATSLGKVVAAAGISFATCTWLQQWGVDRPAPGDTAATLIALLTPEARREWVPPFYLGQGQDYAQQLREHAVDADGALDEALASGDFSRAERQQAAREALVLERWMGSEETPELEEALRMAVARLKNLGETVGWLVETLADIGAECGWPLADCERLRRRAARLALGVAPAGVALARRRVPGLGRDGVRRLVAAGYGTVAEVADAPVEAVSALVGPAVAAALQAEAGGDKHRVLPLPRPPLASVAPAATTPDGAQPAPGPEAVLVLDEGRPDEALFFGQRVALRPAEFRLLRALAEAAGRCVRYEALYDRLWHGDVLAEPGQVYSHRSRLCAKLARAVPDCNVRSLVETVPTYGLRLNLRPEEVRLGE